MREGYKKKKKKNKRDNMKLLVPIKWVPDVLMKIDCYDLRDTVIK